MDSLKKLSRSVQKLPTMQKVVIAAVIVLSGLWLWKNYAVKEGFGYPKTADKTLTCTMYYTEWCPHCKSAKPEWAKLKEMFNGKTVKNTKILIVSIDCEKYPEIAKKQNVTGFPTFKFDLDGRSFDFDGDRRFDNFKRFIEEVLNNDN
jgi:thiol-disulfide isomerase/thioredoxin